MHGDTIRIEIQTRLKFRRNIWNAPFAGSFVDLQNEVSHDGGML